MSTTFVPINPVAEQKKKRKLLQAFFTPESLVSKMVEWLDVYPSARVLEPSSGDGRIVHALLAAGVVTVDACEIEPTMHDRCKSIGANMVATDFLKYFPCEKYDRIAMNPPFSGRTWIKHIEHAYSMLSPGGRIITIVPSSALQIVTECKMQLPGCCSVTYEAIGRDYFKDFETPVSVGLLEINSPNRGDRELHGFCNHSTFNAFISIESCSEKTRDAAQLTTAIEFESHFSKSLAASGSSTYGIDWNEVFAEIKREDELETSQPAAEESLPDTLFGPELKPVTLKMSWADMLGKKAAEMADEIRRARWEQWKQLCRTSKLKDAPDMLSFWTDTSETCTGCKFLHGDWCDLQQLPATVNPILTIRSGMIGMACMGAGWTCERCDKPSPSEGTDDCACSSSCGVAAPSSTSSVAHAKEVAK